MLLMPAPKNGRAVTAVVLPLVDWRAHARGWWSEPVRQCRQAYRAGQDIYRATGNDQVVRFYIRDNSGIAADDLSNLFPEVYRVDNSGDAKNYWRQSGLDRSYAVIALS